MVIHPTILALLGLSIGFSMVAVSDAALAAMSIDIGSQFIKIGLVKPGVPMEIVLNKESRRKTPNIISIRNKERLFAEAAAALASKYPTSAYQYILLLLAKQIGDPSIELYKQRFPFASISFDQERKTVVFPNELETYNVETLLAMILWSAKQTAEAFAGQSVKDVVITIPIFFNQAERRALTVAADIAGLNLLQLLNDGSAAALNYGVFRRKEITEIPQTMLIYDVGASKTTATIVEYVLEAEKNNKDKNPLVRTIGVGYDRNLGGLEITLRLAKHLEKVFRETVKTDSDISTNVRGMSKLHKEAERVKQVLSANKDHFAQVENLHEEHNFRAKVTRDELEAMIVDLEQRFVNPIKDALSMAEKSIDQIDQFVLMGAGTRMPKIQEMIKTVLGDMEIGRFLNTDEAIALGAVYQAAHLSKSFKVLPFAVQELVLYPVQVKFQIRSEDDELKEVSRVIFGSKSHYPTSKKIISFQSYNEDFEISINYGQLTYLNNEQIQQLGPLNISLIGIKGLTTAVQEEGKYENSEIKGVKASFSIDLSGIISIAKAEFVVERKPSLEELTAYEEAMKIYNEKEILEEGKKSDENDVDSKINGTEEVKITTEDPDNIKSEEIKEDLKKVKIDKKKDIKSKPVEPKKKTVKIDLTVSEVAKDMIDMTKDNLSAAKKILIDFEKMEKEKHDHEEAMNALEALVYDLAVKIQEGEEFVEFLTTEEKEKIENEVKRLRVWLEDDVSIDTKTEEFISNKNILDKLIAQGLYRKSENLQMPKAIEALNQMFNHSRIFYETALNMTTTENPVFTETELEILKNLITSTNEWWLEKQAAYEKQMKSEDPVITTLEMGEKIRDLDREVKYLLNKLKNFKPKRKVEKKEENNIGDNESKGESEIPEKKATETTEDKSEEPVAETNDNISDRDPSEL